MSRRCCGVGVTTGACRPARAGSRAGRRATARGAALPPAGEDAGRQVLGQQRVGEVVAPVAVDLEVAAQQPLLAEPEPLDQPLAGQVLRPDVGLHPVQPDLAERVVADERDRQRGHAAAGDRPVDPVAEVARPQRPADDVVDRHLAGQPALHADGEGQRGAEAGALGEHAAHRPVGGRGVPRLPRLRGRRLPRPQPVLVRQAQPAPLGGVAAAQRLQLHRPPAQPGGPAGMQDGVQLSRRGAGASR